MYRPVAKNAILKEAESFHEEMVEETENYSLPIQEADRRNLLKEKEK